MQRKPKNEKSNKFWAVLCFWPEVERKKTSYTILFRTFNTDNVCPGRQILFPFCSYFLLNVNIFFFSFLNVDLKSAVIMKMVTLYAVAFSSHLAIHTLQFLCSLFFLYTVFTVCVCVRFCRHSSLSASKMAFVFLAADNEFHSLTDFSFSRLFILLSLSWRWCFFFLFNSFIRIL